MLDLTTLDEDFDNVGGDLNQRCEVMLFFYFSVVPENIEANLEDEVVKEALASVCLIECSSDRVLKDSVTIIAELLLGLFGLTEEEFDHCFVFVFR